MSDPTLKAVTCPQCGAPATPGESFCRNCGKQILAPTITAQPPAVPQPVAPPPPYQPPAAAPRKRRRPLLLGCLVIIGLIVVGVAAGGIYVWRRASYSPPERKAPDIPQRAAGTMTEFPVDNDPNAPAKPGSVQTETLNASTAGNQNSSAAKLPPGVDRSKLSKGATTMTSATYKAQPKSASSGNPGSTKDNIYICVLNANPGQTGFGEGLATSVVQATGGTQTGVKVQSPRGGTYVGSKIRSAQSYVYVLTKQGGDAVILIYGADPSTQVVVDRLAQNVGNGEGLIDYPELKSSLWTLPAVTPTDLTLQQINTLSGDELTNSMGSGEMPSALRPFIPDRLTSARYTDSSRREWAALNLEYGSTFQAWRTWLLARSALGLGGAQSVTVRDVDALYLKQEDKSILVFQKGPYLIFLSGPGSASIDRLAALGNQIQV